MDDARSGLMVDGKNIGLSLNVCEIVGKKKYTDKLKKYQLARALRLFHAD